MIYRSIINMLVMCGCVGKSGGGWSHYVGQEKLRPQTGWLPLAFGLDWNRPPRQMNSTSFWYSHTDQWRYEKLSVDEIVSPLAPEGDWQSLSLIDFNVRSERMGWLPSAPQLATNPLEVTRSAGDADPVQAAVAGLRDGSLQMSCEDPDDPRNWPRNLFCLALQPARLERQGPRVLPETPARHPARGAGQGSRRDRRAEAGRVWHGATPRRKASSTCWSRSISACPPPACIRTSFCRQPPGTRRTTSTLPTCTPSSTRSRRRSTRSGESRSDWEIFKGIAKTFSEVAEGELGTERDLVLVPTLHDTPTELAQPLEVTDWKQGECDPVPGTTMPNMVVVERDFPSTYRKFTALGPLMTKVGNGGKGIAWNTEDEVDFLRRLNGEVREEGVSQGLPRIESDVDATEVVLALAPETNGHVAVKAWAALGRATGRDHEHLAAAREEDKLRFRDLQAQPR